MKLKKYGKTEGRLPHKSLHR